MAEKLEKNTSAVKTLLFRYGFEPVSRDALYPIEAYNAIKATPGKGARPKKAAAPAKPAKKAKK